MSMTSGQCDELREKAKLLRGHVDGLSAPYVMPSTKELMALTMLDSAGRMEQAADTILELREMAQKANAENAKLRELADAVKEFVEDTHCEDCPCRRDCDDNNRIFCVNDFSYHAFAAMRELGIEAE